MDHGSGLVPGRLVSWLLLLLAAAAGAVDAFCLMRLGGVFAGVITGNLVHVGRAVATRDGELALAAAVAVVGYAAGVAAANVGLRCGRPHRGSGWGRRAGAVAAGECLLLAGVAVTWAVTGGRPGEDVVVVLLVLSSLAMGVQSALSLGSGMLAASTTFLTGTLTGVVGAFTGTPSERAGVAGGLARLTALLCGAAAGALLLHLAPLYAPSFPVVLLGAVAATVLTFTLRRES
ncbi:DUF1275 family protein [Nonomuraea terrae]|uniref:DUF1275 family protein n=1 Tax=Nonomuraea terrae TaxID=2530383 RepID=UPI0037A48A00